MNASPSLATEALRKGSDFLGFATDRSYASVRLGEWDPNGYQLTSIAPAYNGGFWVQLDLFYDASGRVGVTIRKGDAEECENVPHAGSIASIPGRNGY
jgi:hypothetical protein